MTDANIKLAQKTIKTKCCNEIKPLDAMKYHNMCVDCVTKNIEGNIETAINELLGEYKKKTKITKEEEKGIRKWLEHALTFVKEKV